MGVYTYTDNPLGLVLTPRIEDILKLYRASETIERDDIGYLLDEAAKYTTIRRRVQNEAYKLKDSMLDQEYELKSVIGDLVQEIDQLDVTKINENYQYVHELTHFNRFHRGIDKMSAKRIEGEVINALRTVRDLQESFDKNDDGLKVIAYFKMLKKYYGFELEINSETTEKEVLKAFSEQILPKIEEEVKMKEKTISNLKELDFS